MTDQYYLVSKLSERTSHNLLAENMTYVVKRQLIYGWELCFSRRNIALQSEGAVLGAFVCPLLNEVGRNGNHCRMRGNQGSQGWPGGC
jgi:hypothetical protein